MERTFSYLYTFVMSAVVAVNGSLGVRRLLEDNLIAATISLTMTLVLVLIWRKSEYQTWRSNEQTEHVERKIKQLSER